MDSVSLLVGHPPYNVGKGCEDMNSHHYFLTLEGMADVVALEKRGEDWGLTIICIVRRRYSLISGTRICQA